jgi:23S rRNA pseudouridine2457 synthase
VLIAFNKPYRVLTQFTSSDGKSSLADFIKEPDVYPAGRLDFDSEGLLLLTDDGQLQHSITEPRQDLWKRYWVQVEGTPTAKAMKSLESGVVLDGQKTLRARAKVLDGEPALWPRHPAIRVRRNIPAGWLELAICEGRNRQVRRMTAAVGLPTLRLIRVGIGKLDLLALGLEPGASCVIESSQLGSKVLQIRTR